MPTPQTPVRRLPLEGSPNTRDLGGYPCTGGTTRWGSFLRSSNTSKMTAQDLDALRAYGVDTALDLRSEEERSRAPSALEDAPGFEGHHVSLLDQLNSSHFEGDLPGSMSGLYISLLDNSAKDIARVFSILAAAKGGALFHCAAGKDRTGVVAMLLLKLAGVSNADVEADYAATEIYMRPVFTHQLDEIRKAGVKNVPEYGFRSIPESMRRAVQHLEENYGTARQYLQKAGVTEAELATLHEKMVQPY